MAKGEFAEGSVCLVCSMSGQEETIVTQGTFAGYTYIGKEEGLCIVMDDTHGDLAGKTRVIPVSMILSIDLLERKEGSGGKDDINHYYG
ncbi:MAG: hypothetical protein PHU95_03590 [Candidatus Thermoplasmatota archaeon]|nr:hypothetical protein [Candidatus Thermoplasmatota archaeon]